MSTTTLHPVAQQLRDLQTQLNAAFVERDETVEALILALLAKEHAFILGPPGTGKSALVRALFSAFTTARYFETAMSKTRPTEAVMGPIDIKELRDNGNMFRKSKGFITDVEFAFIDEIGKMSSILGHDMLALLNERLVHEVNGGLSFRAAPLYSAVTASNEVITEESDDAAALWDRLLVRCTVDHIKGARAFSALLTGSLTEVTAEVDFKEFADVVDNEVPKITMHKDAIKAVMGLRKSLAAKGIHPSDRRWRQSVKLLQANAFLNGRSEVFEDDLVVLRHTLWETVPQIEEIKQLTASMANPFVEKVIEATRATQAIAKGIEERKDKSFNDKGDYAKDANPKLAQIRADLDALLDSANGRPIPDFKSASDLHKDTLVRLYHVCFGLPEDAAKTTVEGQPKLLGKGDGTA